MSDVLAFPSRVTFEVEALAKLLAEARDMGFAEGMLEAGASDVQRWEAMLERSSMHSILVRFYAAQIRMGK